MASCGEVPSQGSDILHDFRCTKCDKGNRASHFCPACDVYYCVSCLQYLCAHGGILGRNEVSRWGAASITTTADASTITTTTTTTSTDEVECLRHPGRAIETYCSEHDVVCCRLCSAQEHRRCAIKPIKDVEISSSDIQGLLQSVDKIRETLQRVKKNREARQANLAKAREQANDTVREYCDKLHALIDAMNESSVLQINETIESRTSRLQADTEVCENMEKEISSLCLEDDALNRIKIKGFITSKKTKQWMSENTEMLKSLENDTGIETLKMVMHPNIEHALTRHTELGKLTVAYQTLKVKDKSEYSVRRSNYKSKCEIRNIVQIENGRFVIVDYNNKAVNLLDANYSVISECTVSDNPLDICCLNASEVVVSLGDGGIQLLRVGSDLTATRLISPGHYCMGVAHYNGKIYVTDDSKSVYVYSMTGSRLQTFSKDKNGDDMFEQTYRIAFSHDGHMIYVTDHKRGLVTMDTQGNILSTFQSEDLHYADGLCVAEDGRVLVSGYCTSKNVIQLTPEGDTKVGEVMSKSSRVNPHGICIDRNKNKLIVANCGQNKLCVFDLISEDM